MNHKIDGLAIVGLALILLLCASLLGDATSASGIQLHTPDTILTQEATAAIADPAAFAAPYESYTLTQGPHGATYGHRAIDIAAGEGAAILSPIYGAITERLSDQYGNPTLVIENENYRVTLLHGVYTVEVGQTVALGDIIGSESNLGYTMDMYGNLCWGRAGCGYHTHLNVFDKRLGENVNPLDLFDP